MADNKLFTIGTIFSEEAYAHGKMLDHSGWNGKLAQGRSFSDLDAFTDAKGSILLLELSSNRTRWDQEQAAQRWAVESFIKDRLHCAVLARHAVDPTRKIDSYRDVLSFQVMIWHHGPLCSQVVEGVGYWQNLVKNWCNRSGGPLLIHRRIIAAQIKRPQNVVPIRRTNDQS